MHRVPIHYDKPRTLTNNIYIDTAEGESDEDIPKCYQVENNNNKTKPIIKRQQQQQQKRPEAKRPGFVKTSSVEFDDEHIYEMEPTPDFDTSDDADSSVYENTEFSGEFTLINKESLNRKFSSPALLQNSGPMAKHKLAKRAQSTSSPSHPAAKGERPHRHTPDDYEDPDAVLKDLDQEDYMEMSMGDNSMHNTYIDPEDLKRISSSSSATASSGSFTSSKRPDSTSSVPGQSTFSP